MRMKDIYVKCKGLPSQVHHHNWALILSLMILMFVKTVLKNRLNLSENEIMTAYEWRKVVLSLLELLVK